MVRNRLLCGICDDNVRQRLLAKDKLDLETCIKECRSTSITRQQVQQMKTAIATVTNGIPTGMAVSDNVFAVTTRHCDYCGTAHQRGLRFCPAYGRECTSCGRKNHFSTVCKSSRFRKIGRHEPLSRSRNSRSRVRQLSTDDVDGSCFQESEMEIITIRDVGPEDEAEEEVLKVISTTPSRQIFSTMTVSGNRLVQFQIDTGASSKEICRKILQLTEAARKPFTFTMELRAQRLERVSCNLRYEMGTDTGKHFKL